VLKAQLDCAEHHILHYPSALSSRSWQGTEGAVTIVTKVTAFLERALPLAGLAMAVVINLAWIGFLGYGLAKLL
jgi:hypothetical protein